MAHVQPRPVKKCPVFGFDDEIIHVRRQAADRSLVLPHIRFDGCRAELPRDRHPVIAILDEVDIANLVKLNRRQALFPL